MYDDGVWPRDVWDNLSMTSSRGKRTPN